MTFIQDVFLCNVPDAHNWAVLFVPDAVFVCSSCAFMSYCQ